MVNLLYFSMKSNGYKHQLFIWNHLKNPKIYRKNSSGEAIIPWIGGKNRRLLATLGSGVLCGKRWAPFIHVRIWLHGVVTR